MKKILSAICAAVLGLSASTMSTQAIGQYRPAPTVAEGDFSNVIENMGPDYDNQTYNYNIHYSVDTDNIVYLNIHGYVKGPKGEGGPAIVVTTPANYVLSTSEVGRRFPAQDTQTTIYCHKTPLGDGTISWEIYWDGNYVLCPIGRIIGESDSAITFETSNHNIHDESFDTIVCPFIDPYESYVNEIEALKSTIDSMRNSINGDVDGNGILDARDASAILSYYAYVSCGGATDVTIQEYLLNKEV